MVFKTEKATALFGKMQIKSNRIRNDSVTAIRYYFDRGNATCTIEVLLSM